MKIHPARQHTLEWLEARLGLPTASQMHRVVTPAKLQLSEKRHEYKSELLAEWLTGEQANTFTNFAVEYGQEQEPYAREWYAETHKVTVREVGLCLRDDDAVGCSPDGLVGEDGGLELKCSLAPRHVSYLTGDTKLGTEEHRIQVNTCLWITGRAWWDCVAFHPELPKVLVRVTPDSAVFKALDEYVPIFLSEMAAAKLHLIEKGCKPALGPSPTVEEMWK